MLIKQEVQKIMQQFFLNKGEESMLLYEVAKNGDFLLDKPIIVPEKALKSTSERVGVGCSVFSLMRCPLRDSR